MSRGVAPLLGVILFVGITVVLAAGVGAASFALVPAEEPSLPFAESATNTPAPPPVTIAVTATADTNRIAIVHEGGPDLNTSTDTVRIAVDGDGLTQQPPGQFFTTSGFESGPTGPLNIAADPQWTEGEETSVALQDPNPALTAGSSVTVTILRDDVVLAKTTVSAT